MLISKIFSSVRYTLLTLNTIFLITGIAIFSVGISVKGSYNDYHHFLVSQFFSLPAFLITTGVFIFLISAFGFFGAALQNYYLNVLYLVLMVLIFIFELSICIAGYSLYNSTTSRLQKSLLETMPKYGTTGNLDVTILWDVVQRDFECCGVNSADEWPKNLPAIGAASTNLPLSCCIMAPGAVGEFLCTLDARVNEKVVYNEEGCVEALGDWASAHALSMGVAGLIICLIQLVAAVGAGWIAKRSKFEELD